MGHLAHDVLMATLPAARGAALGGRYANRVQTGARHVRWRLGTFGTPSAVSS